MSLRINDKAVKDFIELQKSLPAVLKLFGITQAHIYQNADISRKTFERKLLNQGFTPEEMQRICNVINEGAKNAVT